MNTSLVYAFPHKQIQDMEVGTKRQLDGVIFYFRNLVLVRTGVGLGGREEAFIS